MPLATLEVLMRNVHRPHNGELVNGLTLVEVDEDGVETVIPPELICRAQITTLKEADIHWVSADEAKRLNSVLNDAFDEAAEPWRKAEEALAVAAQQGYERVSTLYESPDEDVDEHHVLLRNQSAEHVDLVLTFFDELSSYYLHHLDTNRGDKTHDTMILRLTDPSHVALAREHNLLCQDDDGYHVQVRVYRSVLWQCRADNSVEEDCLRQFWVQKVRAVP